MTTQTGTLSVQFRTTVTCGVALATDTRRAVLVVARPYFGARILSKAKALALLGFTYVYAGVLCTARVVRLSCSAVSCTAGSS